jgi:hypothetical protein
MLDAESFSSGLRQGLVPSVGDSPQVSHKKTMQKLAQFANLRVG